MPMHMQFSDLQLPDLQLPDLQLPDVGRRWRTLMGDSEVANAMAQLNMRTYHAQKSARLDLGDDVEQHRHTIANVMQGKRFGLFTAIVSIFDTIFIILETDHNAACGGCRNEMGWALLFGRLLVVYYTTEVVVRVYTFRSVFHKDPWNIIDVFLCMASVYFEVATNGFEWRSTNARAFRVLRLGRVFRFVMAFRELQLLRTGFIAMLRTLLWSCLLLLLILTMASIAAVDFVHPITQQLQKDGKCNGDCTEQFKSVFQANLTFFHMFILGDDWAQVGMPIIRQQPSTAWLFVGVAVLLFLGLSNLIMAMIVDQAAESRGDDKDYQELLNNKSSFASKMELLQLCHELDSNGDGFLSKEELMGLCSRGARARSILKRNNISSHQIEDILECFGENVSSGVSYHDFVDVMFRARSIDRSVTLMSMKHQIAKVQATLETSTSAMKNIHELLLTTASQIGNIMLEAEVPVAQSSFESALRSSGAESGVAVSVDDFAQPRHGVITAPAVVKAQATSALAQQETSWCHTIALLEELDGAFRLLMAKYCEAASNNMLNMAEMESTFSLAGKGNKVETHEQVLPGWAIVSSTVEGTPHGTGTTTGVLKACECLPWNSLDVESVTAKRDAAKCCTSTIGKRSQEEFDASENSDALVL